jgi:hypothetical protein
VVQVIQKYDPMAHLGQLFGQGAGQGFSGIANQAVKRQQQLGALENLNFQAGQSPLEGIKNLLSSTAGLEDQGRILQTIAPLYLKQLEAENLSRMGQQRREGTGAGAGTRPVEDQFERNGNVIKKKEPKAGLATKGLNESEFFPTRTNPTNAPGNFPQKQTQGVVLPVLTGTQLYDAALQRNDDLKKNGIIQDFNQTYNQVKAENDENKLYNQTVKGEVEERVGAQHVYGDVGEKALKKVFPNATDEESAWIRTELEKIPQGTKSEAEIERHAAKIADKFKNDVSNIEKNLSAPRIQNKLQRSVMGNESTLKQAEADARRQIQPLIEKGFYDRSRQVLGKAGFYPEEIERTIFGEMPKEFSKVVKSVPKPQKEKGETTFQEKASKPSTYIPIGPIIQSFEKNQYQQKSIDDLKKNILEVYNQDPEFASTNQSKAINPLQLRKEYEDQNYDWRVFKDAMNDLLEDGSIKLTDDQQNQFNSYLNEPPLTLLGKILHKLKLRGR